MAVPDCFGNRLFVGELWVTEFRPVAREEVSGVFASDLERCRVGVLGLLGGMVEGKVSDDDAGFGRSRLFNWMGTCWTHSTHLTWNQNKILKACQTAQKHKSSPRPNGLVVGYLLWVQGIPGSNPGWAPPFSLLFNQVCPGKSNNNGYEVRVKMCIVCISKRRSLL